MNITLKSNLDLITCKCTQLFAKGFINRDLTDWNRLKLMLEVPHHNASVILPKCL